MASYEIKDLYPCDEEGFVYADVLVNDETKPRRLIIPSTTEEAQTVLADYVTAEENAAAPTPPVVEVEVAELIDTPVEV